MNKPRLNLESLQVNRVAIARKFGELALWSLAIYCAGKGDIPFSDSIERFLLEQPIAATQIIAIPSPEISLQQVEADNAQNVLSPLEINYGSEELLNKYELKDVTRNNIALAYEIVKHNYPKLYNHNSLDALTELWLRESGWNHNAQNPDTGAYGISQANPKSGHKTLPKHNDPTSQIIWGIEYLIGRYGSIEAGLEHLNNHNWS